MLIWISSEKSPPPIRAKRDMEKYKVLKSKPSKNVQNIYEKNFKICLNDIKVDLNK